MRSCEVYFIGKEIKIVTKGTSEFGYGIDSEPVIILDNTIEDIILVTKIDFALKNSKSKISVPKSIQDWKKYQDNILNLLKEKNFSNLYKRSTSFNIELLEDGFFLLRKNELFNPKKPSEGLIFGEELRFTSLDDIISTIRKWTNQ